MRLWIALGGWNHEGWDEPIGVFSSKEAAEKAIDQAYDGYDSRCIFSYDVDQAKKVDEIDYNREYAQRKQLRKSPQ